MPKLTDGVTFVKIDETEWPKNTLKPVFFGNKVGLESIAQRRTVVAPISWDNWQDNTGAFYASLANLTTALETILFK